MNANRLVGRRGFLAGAAALGAGLVTAGCSGTYDWYALSRRQFRGKAFCYAAILAGIMIPPQALIALPLARPAIAAVAIFTFVWTWNNFLWPFLAATSQTMMTIPAGPGCHLRPLGRQRDGLKRAHRRPSRRISRPARWLRRS